MHVRLETSTITHFGTQPAPARRPWSNDIEPTDYLASGNATFMWPEQLFHAARLLIQQTMRKENSVIKAEHQFNAEDREHAYALFKVLYGPLTRKANGKHIYFHSDQMSYFPVSVRRIPFMVIFPHMMEKISVSRAMPVGPQIVVAHFKDYVSRQNVIYKTLPRARAKTLNGYAKQVAAYVCQEGLKNIDFTDCKYDPKRSNGFGTLS